MSKLKSSVRNKENMYLRLMKVKNEQLQAKLSKSQKTYNLVKEKYNQEM